MKFGEKLKELRKKMKMTQDEVAASIGISRRAYADYELKHIRPRRQETYDKLAKILGCDANYLRADDSAFCCQIEKKPLVAVEQYYTVKEVAEIRCVCEETVRRWIRRGYLPASIDAKKLGYRILKSDANISWKDCKREEYRKRQETMRIVSIIELFEDFLDERGIKIENPEKEESENPSTIYGTDFGELFEGIKDILKS